MVRRDVRSEGIANHIQENSEREEIYRDPDTAYITFQIFDGLTGELQPWISWLEDFFIQYDFNDSEKLNLAQACLEDEAREWLNWRQSWCIFDSWDEMKNALVLCFGNENERVLQELDSVQAKMISSADSCREKVPMEEVLLVKCGDDDDQDRGKIESTNSVHDVDSKASASMMSDSNQEEESFSTIVPDSESIQAKEVRFSFLESDYRHRWLGDDEKKMLLENPEHIVVEDVSTLFADLRSNVTKDCEQSTSFTAITYAYKMFDRMHLQVHRNQHKKKRILSPKSWKFKFKSQRLSGVMQQIGQTKMHVPLCGQTRARGSELSSNFVTFNLWRGLEVNELSKAREHNFMVQHKLNSRRYNNYNNYGVSAGNGSNVKRNTIKSTNMDIQPHLSWVRCSIVVVEDSYSLKQLIFGVLKFQIKHKWRSKPLDSALDLLLCLTSVVIIITVANGWADVDKGWSLIVRFSYPNLEHHRDNVEQYQRDLFMAVEIMRGIGKGCVYSRSRDIFGSISELQWYVSCSEKTKEIVWEEAAHKFSEKLPELSHDLFVLDTWVSSRPFSCSGLVTFFSCSGLVTLNGDDKAAQAGFVVVKMVEKNHKVYDKVEGAAAITVDTESEKIRTKIEEILKEKQSKLPKTWWFKYKHYGQARATQMNKMEASTFSKLSWIQLTIIGDFLHC